MKSVWLGLVALIVLASGPSWAFDYSQFKNISEIQRALNTQSWLNGSPKKRVRVAVLDKGFANLEKSIGKSLPADTRYHAGPIAAPSETSVEHGRVMAELLNAIATDNGKRPELAPQFELFNVFGFTNFTAAIDSLLQIKPDIVLYSEVWEYGGNFDGQGFINGQINRALDAGITWINAAGNFATGTFNTAIRTGTEEWVQLPDQNNSLALNCRAPEGRKCPLRIVLSWNDFKNEVTEGTSQDLDLALTDDLLNIIVTSALRQSPDKNEARPGYSKYPRELIVHDVSAGQYLIRVKNRSKNFTQTSRLRITVDGEFFDLPQRQVFESILNPADNPRVITVGAVDSDRSSISVQLKKPDLLAMSSVKTSQGEFRGSSNSAAFVAGAFALVMSMEPNWTAEKIKTTFGLSNWSLQQAGMSLNWLGFMPQNQSCFVAHPGQNLEPYLQDMLNVGGQLVPTTAGYRMMMPFDPIFLQPSLKRQWANDMILYSPQQQFGILPRAQNRNVPYGWVEVFQRPIEAGLCNLPQQQLGKIFRLR